MPNFLQNNSAPNRSAPGTKRRSLELRLLLRHALVLVALATTLPGPLHGANGSSVRASSSTGGARPPVRCPLLCQYSVRDVAFVNVHGRPWELQLIRPERIDATQFEQWSETVREKLVDSNVGYVWLDEKSSQTAWVKSKFNANQLRRPAMALVGPESQIIPINHGAQPETSLENILSQLVESPVRHQILEYASTALCVVVMVESDNETKNALVGSMCTAAISQLNDQMWTLEKPTDRGPVLVKISGDQRVAERWLLESLGFKADTLPAVAIVYGQGRRLGEVLAGEQLSAETILGRAAVCGRDCECNLNRDWLYSNQMIHVWNNQRERAAEKNLNFDPNSAFVMAEVSQIIRKNSGQTIPDQRTHLGAGLIIHDLDPIPGNSSKHEQGVDDQAGMSQSPDHAATTESNVAEDQPVSNPPTLLIPWPLVTGLLVALAATFAWFRWKGSGH